MIKYLFDGKVQIFTHKFFNVGFETNLQEKYGKDTGIYNSVLRLGYLYICW